jgi:hypothetical protein
MTKKTFIALLILFLTTIGFIQVGHTQGAYAHQSGCHRWHSCPSDTGSYVCGDLGYDTYCPTYDVPDYAEQGEENGSNHAQDNEAYITSLSEEEANNEGNEDGQSDDYGYATSDASATCDTTFDFDSPQSDEYIDSFEDSYLESCTEIYEYAYASTYETAYTEAQEARTQDLENSEPTAKSESDNTLWWWVIGICVVVGIAYGTRD